MEQVLNTSVFGAIAARTKLTTLIVSSENFCFEMLYFNIIFIIAEQKQASQL